MTANDLNDQFGIADVVRFEAGPGGLLRGVVSGPQAEGVIYLHGSHVTHWAPRGQRPVLYISSRSKFEPGTPIRGGVPLIFPWFGPRSDGRQGPLHGFARVAEWTLESAGLRPDGAVELNLALAPGETSRSLGYDSFQLRFRAAFGSRLELELEVANHASTPLHFEDALHTYFSIADIHRVGITGLAGTTYVDKTDALARKQAGEVIRITRETDQVHLNTAAACEIDDPVWQRRIVVEKSGSSATVVWNPWIEKCRSLADMAPDDWQSMLCLETANALDNAVTLRAGAVHRTAATIRLQGEGGPSA